MNNPIQNIMQLMMSNQNPNMIIQNSLSQNPQFQALMNQIQQSGMTPTQYLNQYTKQNNINLGPFRNFLSSRGIKF